VRNSSPYLRIRQPARWRPVDQRGSPAAASSSWRLGVSTARGSLAGERERSAGPAHVRRGGRRSSRPVVPRVSPPDTRGGRGAGAVGEGASTRRQRPAGQHEDQKTRLPRPGVGCSSLSLSLSLFCLSAAFALAVLLRTAAAAASGK
jgi:hypothetical protein